MPEFVCRIADDRGQVSQRVETAGSEVELRDRYTQQGFYIYSIRPRAGLAALSTSGRGPQENQAARVSDLQPAVCHADPRRPADPEGAGPALGHIAQPSLRASIDEIRESVKGGSLLSEAFREQKVFPGDLHHVAAGGRKKRQPGRGARPLHQLPAHRADREEEAAGLAGLPGAADGDGDPAGTFLVTYVIPNFAELYRTMSQDLPPMTLALITFTDAFRSYWIVLSRSFSGLRWALGSGARRRRADRRWTG